MLLDFNLEISGFNPSCCGGHNVDIGQKYVDVGVISLLWISVIS